MSADDTKKSTSPAPTTPVVKDAEVVSAPSDNKPTGPRPITFGQHLFIWSMVLLVGVIFGVGSSFTFLQHSAPERQGVAQTDIILRRQIADRLENALKGAEERFAIGNEDAYAYNIRLARLAAAEGLKPAGSDLDRVVEEFLDRKLPPGLTRTYRDALNEQRGTTKEVTRNDLRMFLADRSAIQALTARNMPLPAVSLVVLGDLVRGRDLTYNADQVVLDATHLLQPVPADDPEVQATYDKLRPARFTKRAQVAATIASADLAALAAKAVVGDAEIQAYYDAHKEQYKKPPVVTPKLPEVPLNPPVPTPPPAVEYKPLAEVSAAIKATLAHHKAVEAGTKVVEDFNRVVEDQGLESADAAAFAKAATAAGLKVTTVAITEPVGGAQLDLGTFGRIADPTALFTKAPGFISSPLQSGAPDPEDKEWFVLRVDGLTPAGFKPLDEVREEVRAVVAGNRAYKALLEQAEALRAAAEKRGPGGLKQVMADPANAVWKATLTSATPHILTELTAPPSEPGGIPGEARLVGSLGLPDRPVVLVTDDAKAGDVPRVKLLQIASVTRKTDAPPVPAERAADFYRQQLETFREAQFRRQLGDQLER